MISRHSLFILIHSNAYFLLYVVRNKLIPRTASGNAGKFMDLNSDCWMHIAIHAYNTSPKQCLRCRLQSLFLVSQSSACGVAACVRHIVDSAGLSLNDLQLQSIVEIVVLGRSIFLTGGAGTGKSVVSRHLGDFLDVHFVAPTGAAALNVGGSTIHSTFNVRSRRVDVRLKRVFVVREAMLDGEGGDEEREDQRNAEHTQIGYERYETTEVEVVVLTPRLKEKLSHVQTLCIDEISMVSERLLDLIDAALKEVKNNVLPFGGVQVVMVGDFFQLRPVKGTYCFSSTAWRNAESHPSACNRLTTVSLTETMRQDPSEKEYVSLLNRARVGNLNWSDIDWIRKHTIEYAQGDDLPNLLCWQNSGSTIRCKERNEIMLDYWPGEKHMSTCSDSLWETRTMFWDPVRRTEVLLRKHQTPLQWAMAHRSQPYVLQQLCAVGTRVDAWLATIHSEAKARQRFVERHPLHERAVANKGGSPSFAYKIGVRVMCTRNLYELDEEERRYLWLANGQLGTILARVRTVVGMDEEGNVLTEYFDMEDDEEDYDADNEHDFRLRIMWDKIGDRAPFAAVVGRVQYQQRQSASLSFSLTGDEEASLTHSRLAMPLRLAFARTLHSSQGTTIDQPCDLNLHETKRYDGGTSVAQAEAGLVYVGLSRFTRAGLIRLVGGKGGRFHPSNCRADPMALRFYSNVGVTAVKWWVA